MTSGPATTFPEMGMRAADLEAIDRMIGANIRFHRLRSQLSQAKLAARIGISFQQLQKYERGINRIAASRLLHIAEALGVSIAALLAGSHGSSGAALPCSLATERDAARLMSAYALISDARLRRLVVQLLEHLHR